MNEVRLNPAASVVTGTTSSAGSGDKRKDAVEAGKSLPPSELEMAAKLQEAKAALADEEVSQAVADLNSYVQNEQRDLLFSVDEGSGDMVVRVVDRESGDLIRQIPNEVVLDLAAKARDNEPLQLINMHG